MTSKVFRDLGQPRKKLLVACWNVNKKKMCKHSFCLPIHSENTCWSGNQRQNNVKAQNPDNFRAVWLPANTGKGQWNSSDFVAIVRIQNGILLLHDHASHHETARWYKRGGAGSHSPNDGDENNENGENDTANNDDNTTNIFTSAAHSPASDFSSRSSRWEKPRIKYKDVGTDSRQIKLNIFTFRCTTTRSRVISTVRFRFSSSSSVTSFSTVCEVFTVWSWASSPELCTDSRTTLCVVVTCPSSPVFVSVVDVWLTTFGPCTENSGKISSSRDEPEVVTTGASVSVFTSTVPEGTCTSVSSCETCITSTYLKTRTTTLSRESYVSDQCTTSFTTFSSSSF